MQSAINKEILRLALPAIVSNITTPLLGLVDSAITGHMGGAVYVGAIAVGGTMFSLAYWALNFLRMGTSGLTSQACGAELAGRGEAGATSLLLMRSLAVAFCLAVALIAASPWIADALLWMLDADAATTAMARSYFMIVVWGAPAVLGVYALSGWFLGMQDSRASMWMALLTNVANIAVSLVLVYGFGLKIVGVACGTLVAQWLGFGLGLAMSLGGYGVLRAMRGAGWRRVVDMRSLRRFFSLNADIFLRTLCLALVTMWFTRAGASVSPTVLAANALLMQLFILFSYFMDGFAFAGEAMAGKYCGARQPGMVSATVRGIFLWGAAVAAVFTAAYGLGGRAMLRMLTSEASVVDAAMRYLPWVWAVPAAGVAAFVWDGIFIGMTRTRDMLLSMAVASTAYFVVYFALRGVMGNHGLWLAFITYLALRGIVETLLFRRSCRRCGS